MSRSPSLRSPRPCLCRWVLACLLLSWGLAYAAPLLRPAVLASVCSSVGAMRLVDRDSGKSVEQGALGGQGLPDCAQCLSGTLTAPPPTAPAFVIPALLPASIAQRGADCPCKTPTRAPQARGPPLSV